MVEDAAAVLSARVRALAVLGRWVVHLVKELEQGLIRDFVRVEVDLEGFGICF